MKLIDALEVLKHPVKDGDPAFRVSLACGFTPLHLQTFLTAQLRIQAPCRSIKVSTGLFGDLIGTIEVLKPADLDVLVVMIEWGDLDPRLSIRNLGGWRLIHLPDILKSTEEAADRLRQHLLQISRLVPTVVCLPTLPLPPMFSTRPEQLGQYELQLRHKVASLGVALAEQSGIRIVNPQLLDETSASAVRFDVKSDITTGFPYSLSHASELGNIIANLIHTRSPKKGLITDLDDTLWNGILGEDGVNGISWHLERGTLMHGLYQQFIASLASAGVLLGVASKNDPILVERAFDRSDLLVSRNDIFPFEVHWSDKSKSIKQILDLWNVGADSVVFIDDSPMEIAEVKTVFPDLECILFPKNDFQGIWDLLKHLRGIFGKPNLTEEDFLRLKSIRTTAAVPHILPSVNSSDNFLKTAEASLIIKATRDGEDARAFELVNKTNQFNLNGRRYGQSEWRRFFNDPTSFLLTASYQDKYGPLGKIAVIMGKTGDRKLFVNTWVLSCRAFSRRIEYQCLKYLFDKFKSQEITFDFEATVRNGPLQNFFSQLLDAQPEQGVSLSRELFERNAPPLFHHVTGDDNV